VHSRMAANMDGSVKEMRERLENVQPDTSHVDARSSDSADCSQ
jgi:hypothetical protein